MKIDTVLNIDITEPIDINVNGEQETISLYEAARWAALMRGLDYITEKAIQLKINLDKEKTWVKPLALQKFVDEETPAFVANIKNIKTEQE